MKLTCELIVNHLMNGSPLNLNDNVAVANENDHVVLYHYCCDAVDDYYANDYDDCCYDYYDDDDCYDYYYDDGGGVDFVFHLLYLLNGLNEDLMAYYQTVNVADVNVAMVHCVCYVANQVFVNYYQHHSH